MTDINDLVSVPETETVSAEDYVILNIAKEIKQIQIRDLCSFIGDIIPIIDEVFPKALTLNDIIKTITNKINTINAREIGYDGEMHMEYGTVHAIISYILDIINKYETGGFKGSNVEFIPSEDTPDRVIERFPSASINDILNYILDSYRHSDDDISQQDIVANTSTWDISDTDGIKTLQDQIDKLYTLSTKESIYGNIYESNPTSIELSRNDTDIYTIANDNMIKHLSGAIEIAFSISINCVVPGTLYIGVFKDNELVQSFNSSLPVGDSIISPFTFTNITDEIDTPFNMKIKIGFKKDIKSNEIPAVIPVNGFTVRYSGDKLKLKEG